MTITASLPIVADRHFACVRTLRFRGIDLTGAGLAAEVRLSADTPGLPLARLDRVAAAGQGLRLLSVVLETGVPVSTVLMRINKSVVEAMPGAGAPAYLEWDLSIQLAGVADGEAQRRVAGDFVVLPGVLGADNINPTGAPAGRPMIAGWSTADLTFGDQTVDIRLSGTDLLAPLVASAAGSAATAEDFALQAGTQRTGAEAAFVEAETAVGRADAFAGEASTYAQAAATQLVPTYATFEEGNSASADGGYFYVGDGRTVALYRKGTSTAAAPVATFADGRLAGVSAATYASAQALRARVAPQTITTRGYWIEGDKGGTTYLKVAAEPAHAGKLSIVLLDGTVQWYQIQFGTRLSPYMIGAKDRRQDPTYDATAILNAFGEMEANDHTGITDYSGSWSISDTITVLGGHLIAADAQGDTFGAAKTYMAGRLHWIGTTPTDHALYFKDARNDVWLTGWWLYLGSPAYSARLVTDGVKFEYAGQAKFLGGWNVYCAKRWAVTTEGRTNSYSTIGCSFGRIKSWWCGSGAFDESLTNSTAFTALWTNRVDAGGAASPVQTSTITLPDGVDVLALNCVVRIEGVFHEVLSVNASAKTITLRNWIKKDVTSGRLFGAHGGGFRLYGGNTASTSASVTALGCGASVFAHSLYGCSIERLEAQAGPLSLVMRGVNQGLSIHQIHPETDPDPTHALDILKLDQGNCAVTVSNWAVRRPAKVVQSSPLLADGSYSLTDIFGLTINWGDETWQRGLRTPPIAYGTLAVTNGPSAKDYVLRNRNTSTIKVTLDPDALRVANYQAIEVVRMGDQTLGTAGPTTLNSTDGKVFYGADGSVLSNLTLPAAPSGSVISLIYDPGGAVRVPGWLVTVLSPPAEAPRAGSVTIAVGATEQAVAFPTPRANSLYTVGVSARGAERAWLKDGSRTASGFTVVRAGTTGALPVDWTVTATNNP